MKPFLSMRRPIITFMSKFFECKHYNDKKLLLSNTRKVNIYIYGKGIRIVHQTNIISTSWWSPFIYLVKQKFDFIFVFELYLRKVNWWNICTKHIIFKKHNVCWQFLKRKMHHFYLERANNVDKRWAWAWTF